MEPTSYRPYRGRIRDTRRTSFLYTTLPDTQAEAAYTVHPTQEGGETPQSIPAEETGGIQTAQYRAVDQTVSLSGRGRNGDSIPSP